ncbi:hypothetical protein [Chelativorans salis]|uniref:Pilus assembly protein n=1 Tax=Chelativorans salis TaxID=2978478 RepID=A0ABT2LJ84_9HYPH|nr:hypothetical protein [Chelativorans sp. EGI FJ00035]MCT7374650.1 hypothetical protein [Chelativorans sp. EGI FJ00035]
MRSARSKAALALVSALPLAGCADYLNNRDTVTLGAGNAMEANVGIHTIDPFPPHADRVYIPGDGPAVARAQRIYRRSQVPAQTAQGAQTEGN